MSFIPSTGYREDELQMARYAKAMGHPARIAILKYLTSTGICCFSDISNELPIAKATVCQHLSELKDAGLITGSIESPRVNYCIDMEAWKKAGILFDLFFNHSNKGKGGYSCCS